MGNLYKIWAINSLIYDSITEKSFESQHIEKEGIGTAPTDPGLFLLI
jgi:hypothetical protein